MINRRTAIMIVPRKLNHPDRSQGHRLQVFDELTIERPWGWVMYFGTEEAYYNGDIKLAASIEAPFLVNRVTSELLQAGKSWPIEKYIEDYELSLGSIHRNQTIQSS